MKKLSILSAIFFPLLLICHNGFSQVTEEWVVRYNGPDNNSDQGRLIITDASGNVIVTGQSAGKKSTVAYITTVKYSPAGTQQNLARYGGTGYEYPHGLTVDVAGNVYVTGTSKGSGSNVDIVTIKYNASLVEQWVRRFNGPENLNDIPEDIVVDESGNVYVTGYTGSPSYGGNGGKSIVTLKYNSLGTLQPGFPIFYDNLPNNGPVGSNQEEGTSLALDGNENIYVTGESGGLVTIKYNSLGQFQWSRHGNGSHGRKILVDGSNDLVVTSWGNDDVYVTVKYNSNGDLLWEAFYNGDANGFDGAWDMALDASGNVYVTGISSNASNNDYATVKYNSNGIQQWASRYNGSGNDRDHATAIAVDVDGNAYVTGFTVAKSGRNTVTYYGTVKYASATGNQEWVAIYKGPENGGSSAWDITVDASGNAYVTGGSTGKSSSTDYATVKYSQGAPPSKSITTIPTPEISNIFQLRNFPNPFNGNTTIEYQLPVEEKVRLSVYDLSGKQIATLVNEFKPAGIHRVNFAGNKLSAGTYFYRLQSGEYIETKKLTILK